MDIIKPHLNTIFRPRAPNPYVPAPEPFKGRRRRVQMHWNDLCIEFACGNGWNHDTFNKNQALFDFCNFWKLFWQTFGETIFSKNAPNTQKSERHILFSVATTCDCGTPRKCCFITSINRIYTPPPGLGQATQNGRRIPFPGVNANCSIKQLYKWFDGIW